MPKATATLSLTLADVAFTGRNGFDDDDAEDRPFKRLTAEEAAALAQRIPTVSPWQVVGAQLALGTVIAALAWLLADAAVAVSALYGALVAVLPGALMARGTTSRLSRLTVATSAVSVMFWAGVKLGVSVLMLALAPQVVRPLSWPALLLALVLCLQVYWFALLWRGRSKN